MRAITNLPCEVHILVCANHRPPGGLPSCDAAETGTQLFDALKAHVLQRRLARRVWVTQTRCLGYCHASGATVAIYQPRRKAAPVFLQGVTRSDLDTLIRTWITPLEARR